MGEKRIGEGSFVEAFMAPGVGANRRLDRIDGLFKWYRFEKLLKPLRSEVGRPGYPALSMFKALLLQQWYGLSDPGLEEALLDRLSFRRFCGFSLDDATPDETTFVRFRAALGEAGLSEKLFAEVNRQLDKRGGGRAPSAWRGHCIGQGSGGRLYQTTGPERLLRLQGPCRG